MGQHGPAGQRVAQYRGRVRCGEEVDEPVDHHRDQPDGAFVVAALDGVGDLQPQLGWQVAEVEGVGPIRQRLDRPGARGELRQVQAPALAPPPVVAVHNVRAQAPRPQPGTWQWPLAKTGLSGSMKTGLSGSMRISGAVNSGRTAAVSLSSSVAPGCSASRPAGCCNEAVIVEPRWSEPRRGRARRAHPRPRGGCRFPTS